MERSIAYDFIDRSKDENFQMLKILDAEFLRDSRLHDLNAFLPA